MDIFRTVKIGGASKSSIQEILHSVINIPIISIIAASGGMKSASATWPGITSGHSIMWGNQSAVAANAGVVLYAAAGNADVLTVTAMNVSGSAVTTASANYSFWAFK